MSFKAILPRSKAYSLARTLAQPSSQPSDSTPDGAASQALKTVEAKAKAPVPKNYLFKPM